MLTDKTPNWFKWFLELGATLASIDKEGFDERALRVFLSVPSSEYTVFALALGAMSVNYSPSLIPVNGDKVTSWVGPKFGEFTLQINSESQATIGGSKVIYPGWPVAVVPTGTPENRNPRSVPDSERDELQRISGVHPHGWYKWYAALCIHPVSVIGHKSQSLIQRDEIQDLDPSWLTPKGLQLLNTYSQQITNPERFQFFPFSIFSPEVTQNRKWLREMESRLVICESFSAFDQMHPQFQQMASRVVLMDRRKDGSVKGNGLIKDFQEINPKPDVPQLEVLLKNAPAGVFSYYYLEENIEDFGNSNAAYLETYEL